VSAVYPGAAFLSMFTLTVSLVYERVSREALRFQHLRAEASFSTPDSATLSPLHAFGYTRLIWFDGPA